MKVFIAPNFPGADRGEGGIRRVVEAQRRWLPKYGYDITDDIKDADIVALHAGEWVDPPVGVPVVSHCHGLYWSEYKWPSWADTVNKTVIKNLKQADRITAPSEWVATAIRRNTWLNPDVLYHGIEPDEWPSVAENQGYVLWNKTRPDVICDPAPVSELAERRPDINFTTTFVEKGVTRPNINIIDVESYSQARYRVRHAGVYLATTRETMGIGTLEAMAAGVPILGYNWGGQPEIVVHKEHGYLAEPGDYDDLALGLDYCLEHRAYLSQQARAHVLAEFTWEHWIEQYAKLYTRVLEEARGPKVSVVITNYNLGEFLPEAVNSAKKELVGKPYKSEIIIVDDASTEPLPDAVTNDPSLRIVKNTTNLYLAGALNVGVRTALGQYVLLLDADNRVKNLHLLVDALDNDRSLDIAYGKMQVFGGNYKTPLISDWPPKEADHLRQLQHNNQITSTALYRRRLFTWVGDYRERCRLGEDADFWLRALAAGARARRVTDLVTLEYRDRNDSVSHQHKDWEWNRWYFWSGGQYKLAGVGGPIYIHDKPKVSVIIPVGPGHERYLLDAVDSVQAQSQAFWEWECIVVNDSGNELKGLPSWVRVTPGGRGVSHARNRGMALAKSEYILFLDADDYLHPEALYHLYNTLTTSNCHNVFVYSDWFEVETGKRHESPDFNPKTIFEKLANPVTALYRKWDLTKNNVRWDESFVHGWEDWDFAIQVAAKAGLCGLHLRAPLLHYRIKSGTLRHEARLRADEIKLAIQHKWADYISGVKENRSEAMPGCGGCGGGRYPSILSNVPQTGPFDGVDIENDTSLVLYTPPPEWTGTRSFLGRVTHNRYRFSPEPPGNVRRVYNVDVPGLQALGYFRPATVDNSDVGAVTPLASPGPPSDEVVGGGGAA
jgi:glycosyltransferase involved in cell wall biosynthesis